MNDIIPLAIGFFLGIILALIAIPKHEQKKFVQKAKEVANNLNSSRQQKKEERKKKIILFLRRNEAITNNDVEDLLSVADSTATLYLQELEDEGMIEQVGKTGRSVHYRLAHR